MSIEDDLSCLGVTLAASPKEIKNAVMLIDAIEKLTHFEVAILVSVSETRHRRDIIVNQAAVDKLIALSFIEESYTNGKTVDPRLVVTELGDRVVDYYLLRTFDE